MRPWLALAGLAVAVSTAAAQTPAAGGPPPSLARGARVDVSRFPYQRPLPQGPPGLVVLPLDAAVLAHSQGPQRRFGDLRIVDDQGAQIPYILEPRETLTLDLAPRAVSPDVRDLRERTRGQWSFYLLTLPFEDLPGPALVLETSEPIFKREIELGVQRPADRRRREPWFDLLVRTTWQHTEEGVKAAPLELTFATPRGRDLLLAVGEGDNRPLTLTAARLLLPGWQVRFVRPAAPLRLVYGNRDIASPRYDVALLGAAALRGEAAPIVAATEAARPRPDAVLSPLAFWIVLGVAVLALLAVLARLISSGPAPPPSPPAP